MSFTFDVFLSVMNEIQVYFVFIYVFYYWRDNYGEPLLNLCYGGPNPRRPANM